jgi:hypothetical protein
MAPRSRTGKLMQGLFGRFGNKKPAQPTIDLAAIRQNRQRAKSEFDEAANSPQQGWGSSTSEERDFPSADRFDDDDEETNWDDAEAFGDENNPIVPRIDRKPIYAQPTIPVTAPTQPPVGDLDEWDEALPAATVISSNMQEARRGKPNKPVLPVDDIWGDDLTVKPQQNSGAPSFPSIGNSQPTAFGGLEQSSQLSQSAEGLWSRTLDRFRQLLPPQFRRFSNAILIAIAVTIVTVGIWFVDGFFVPGIDRSVAAPSPAPLVAAPVSSEPKVNPEQAFTQAIQSQLSDITSQYPDEIIQTLNIDIDRDRLVVQLNPSWYTLDDDRQNTLTDRMWLQAQSNHFTKLEIQDSQGITIARSPVVGKHPIILQRRSIETSR